MGYLYICIATIIFSVQIIFTKKYQLQAGQGLLSCFLYNAISPILFLLIMFIYNKFSISFTPFSIIIAIIYAIIINLITFFSLKALSMGSVVNYTLYLLCGGMVLPFIYGIFFNNDRISVFKIISLCLIVVAIVIKMDFKEKDFKKKIFIYLGLFITNGLMGVLNSIHTGTLFSYAKVTKEEFTILQLFFTIIIGLICFIVIKIKTKQRLEINIPKSFLWAGIGGLSNGLGNFLLLIALTIVEPSIQYPLLTGGIILLSLVTSLIMKEKITKKAIFSVIIALIGTILIVF